MQEIGNKTQETITHEAGNMEGKKYSAEEVFEKLKSVLAWKEVGDTIYSNVYTLKATYPETVIGQGQEDNFLLSRIFVLTVEQRKEIASHVGSLKFEVNALNDITKKHEMAQEEAREISKIIFPELSGK